ncbi:hypothetical protein [Streptomyces sp. Root369]|uniref:hypothetical protein n=1 Tax=Streptomyces sp. Root369 TaxID=1736523 RepID=UPI000AF57F50|nr:hypothetical protein [Streptomyces sp. Root369]
MYNGAEDDNERRRIQAKLYAMPKELRRPRRERAQSGQQQPQRGVMTMQDAQALMAQMAAQDAQLSGR